MDVRVGTRVPDFTLPDDAGKTFHLYDELKEGPIAIYFFPKDFTSGCTAEACEFRDNFALFRQKGVAVVGISTDDTATHARFRKKYALPFRLLSDSDHRVADMFGVRRTLGMIPGRTTFLIGKDGVALHIFISQLQARRHAREALEAMTRSSP